MANSVRFACTSLAGTNKVGNLKVDENGYYPMVVGALAMFNSAGEFYVAGQAKELFESSGQLMRRVKRGALRAEYGHPKPQPGQSERSFAARVLQIEETRVCAHHMDLTLDFDNVRDENGQKIIAIVSRVKPSGPYGSFLEQSLQNKNENVCFSIRAFTDDRMVGGVNHRTLRQIITFDMVNEPGMKVAEKYFSPALESQFETTFMRSTLEAGLKESQRNGLATESTVLTAVELFTSLGWDIDPAAKPLWTKW
jgi:hypothetical protein